MVKRKHKRLVGISISTILQWIGAMLFLLTAMVISGELAYNSGYNTGREIGKAESDVFWKYEVNRIQNQLSPFIYDSGPDYYDQWLQEFMDGVQSANISLQFDQSGYNKGVISIYFERQ